MMLKGCWTYLVGAFLCLGMIAGCSKKDEGAQGKNKKESSTDRRRLSGGQLAKLLPRKVGDFALFEKHADMRDGSGKSPASTVKVTYTTKYDGIDLRLIDLSDSPDGPEAMRTSVKTGGKPVEIAGSTVWSKDTRTGGSQLGTIIGDRFYLVLSGRRGVNAATLQKFFADSGLAATLAKAPSFAEAGDDKPPAWAAAATDVPPTLPKRPEKAEEKLENISDCATLLQAADVKQACGTAITVKGTGMAGKLNTCNHHGGGLIFLLSRHRDWKTARQAAELASGKSLETGQLYAGDYPTGGFVAVAPIKNVLLELKSFPKKPGASPPCTKKQLESLAKVVVSRLDAAR